MEDATEPTEVDSPDSSVGVSEEPAESYTVKVDGSEEQVSLEELRDGYQRQSDYTRKTQELASERKRLQQAEAIVTSLEADPEGTMSALADAFGISTNQASKTTEVDPYSAAWGDDTPDPTEDRIRGLEQKLAAQDRVHRRQQVEKQVEDLKGQYGEFDAHDLFQHALANKITNLEAALTHMRYDDVSRRAQKLEQDQERTEAKRDASVVTPSGSKQAGSSKAAPEKVSSIREAFENAKRELAS
jgi:hypothetical protein